MNAIVNSNNWLDRKESSFRRLVKMWLEGSCYLTLLQHPPWSQIICYLELSINHQDILVLHRSELLPFNALVLQMPPTPCLAFIISQQSPASTPPHCHSPSDLLNRWKKCNELGLVSDPFILVVTTTQPFTNCQDVWMRRVRRHMTQPSSISCNDNYKPLYDLSQSDRARETCTTFRTTPILHPWKLNLTAT
jgi:hypothetical protein